MVPVDAKMEPLAPHARPPLSPEDSLRIQFDCSVRLWGLEARFLAQKLLSLGRSYEVRYRLPPVGAGGGATSSELQLADFGFQVMSLMDSHLLQVKSVNAPRIAQQIVPERSFVGIGIPRPEEIRAIRVEDYLVGMNTQDFLVVPVPLPQLRKQMQHLQSVPRAEKELVLRFVRLDRFVQVDQQRTHGHVLDVLKHIETKHAELAKTYATLLDKNRAIVTRELTREKKLLAYVRIIAVETRKTVMEDERFQFAFNFQQWYAAINEIRDEDDASSDEDEGEEMQEEQHNFEYDEIEISDDDDEDDDRMQEQRQHHPKKLDMADLIANEPAAAKPSRAKAVQPFSRNSQRPIPPQKRIQPIPKQPRPVQQPVAKPVPKKPSALRSIDMTWVDYIASQDLKWLPHAKESLRNFIAGLMDSFEQEDFSHSRIPEITRSIAEQLLYLYIHKRHTLSIDNSALHKEFARHVRMLRSNLKNQKNVKLREDLLHGAVTAQRLCEMSSDELAPEALRLERERRYEQHAQSSMLKAPTGPTLVKTKHGYKEVNFGEIVGATTEPEAPTDEASAATTEEHTVPAEAPPVRATSENTDISTPIQIEGFSIVPPLDAGDLPVIEPLAPKPTTPDQRNSLDGLEDNSIDGIGETDEVTERFQTVMDIEKQSPTTKKRVSFAEDVSIAHSINPSAATRNESTQPEPANQKPAFRPVGVKEARDFLLALFNPAYDLSESLRLFVDTLKAAPLATMSREFVLAPGVKLYREPHALDQYVYKVQVQLGHLYVESTGRNERQTNIDAVDRLIASLGNFKRLFGDLLDQLSHKYRFDATNDSRQVRDRVFSYLVGTRIVKSFVQIVMPPVFLYEENGVEIEEYQAQISIDNLLLASCRNPTLTVARNEVSQELLSFLLDLITQRSTYHEPQYYNGASAGGFPSSSHQHGVPPPQRNLFRPEVQDERTNYYDEDQDMEPDRFNSNETRQSDEDRNLYRKRQYQPSRDDLHDEPVFVRQRVEEAPLSYERSDARDVKEPLVSTVNPSIHQEAAEKAPLFYVDNAGDQKPHADRTLKALTEEQRIKAEIGAYHELMKKMFEDRDDVMTRLNNIVWDATREYTWIEFSSKLGVTQVVKKVPGKDLFWCELQIFEGRMRVHFEDKILEVAGRRAMDELKQIIDRIFADWQLLLRTYRDRKKNTPTTLMAGNETRSKNQRFLAIRHKCLNQKMAKRSASEEFRDVLESFYEVTEQKIKAEATASNANRTPGGSAQRNIPNIRAETNQPRQPEQKKKAANLVLCSEDEDDDDESDYSSDDSDYGRAPVTVKSDNIGQTKSQMDATAVKLMDLLEKEKRIPYDMSSERVKADDARLRAVMRSLFTISDDLCAGISSLRGYLKFAGSAEKEIVQNVKATIHMERLQEGILEVRVAVNDVIHFKAAEATKHDACNAAIDGALKKLNEIRNVWVQLIHFFHMKELSVSNITESFQALRLANIAPCLIVSIPVLQITTTIEKTSWSRDYGRRASLHVPSQNGVHCVLKIGDYVVYRVAGDTEEEAKALADCRTAKYIANLIDAGLDPEPVDGEDVKMPIDLDGGAISEPPIDWSCLARIADVVDSASFQDFRVGGTWCLRETSTIPSAEEFPVANLVITQCKKIPIKELEDMLSDLHESAVTFFTLESAFEQWKLVRAVAAYGHKAPSLAFALELNITPACKYSMYLIPPGASINSKENLYWPESRFPRELRDRKQIYGFIKPRFL
ncbi:hypothetical protein FI667_g2707, partial [Globisporangium splendens]